MIDLADNIPCRILIGRDTKLPGYIVLCVIHSDQSTPQVRAL